MNVCGRSARTGVAGGAVVDPRRQRGHDLGSLAAGSGGTFEAAPSIRQGQPAADPRRPHPATDGDPVLQGRALVHG